MERVGLDVGGTSIKAGRITDTGQVLEERSFELKGRTSELASALVDLAKGLGAEGSIGIGLPGLLDRERGVIRDSPNLKALEGLAVRDVLSEALGIDPAKVGVENDANAAALGEAWMGAARDMDDVLMVTLGTGVGGGLVLGGRLHTGGGLGGEIGHVRIDPRGPKCGCGGHGCVEVFASATAARRRAVAAGLPASDPGNLELLSKRARDGEAPEAALLFDIGHDLGIGLSTAICLLDLRNFVIGGGFSAAIDGLLPGIRAGIREGAYGDRVDEVKLVRATLGGSAGWIGSARIAFLLA